MSRFQAVDFHAPGRLIDQDGHGHGSTCQASVLPTPVEPERRRPVRSFVSLTGEQGQLSRLFFSGVRYGQRRILELLQADRAPPEFVDTQAMVQPLDAEGRQARGLPPDRG
jgi:hypothetical protein